MKSVSKDLKALLGQRFGPRELDRVAKLASEFHGLNAPEDDKLTQKDKNLMNLLINGFVRDVLRAFRQGNITVTERALFLVVAALFLQVEGILWELKGHGPKEPIPKPDPMPPDDDDGDDDDGRRI